MEWFSGHAIEHPRRTSGFEATPTSELGAKANAVQKLWRAAIRKLRKVQLCSCGTRIPTTELSRQRGIWRFWVTLSFPCRIAAYSNVSLKQCVHDHSNYLPVTTTCCRSKSNPSRGGFASPGQSRHHLRRVGFATNIGKPSHFHCTQLTPRKKC
jgi:hypothetical protein